MTDSLIVEFQETELAEIQVTTSESQGVSVASGVAESTDWVPEGTTNLYFTAERAAASAPVQSVAGKIGAVIISKSDVGLGNVDNTSDLNKPVSAAVQTALNGKQPAGSYVTTSDSRLTDSRTPILHKSTHASGGTDALSPSDIGAAQSVHTHTIADVSELQSALNSKAAVTHTHTTSDISGLASVASTGAYSDLSGKPALAAVATTGDYADLTGKPATFAPSAHTHTKSQITDFPTLSTVATSGAYSDLTGKPPLAAVATTGAFSDLTGKPSTYPPSAHSHAISDVTGLQTALDGKQAAGSYAAASHTHTVSGITDFPTLGTLSAVNDAPSDGTQYARKDGAWEAVAGGGSSYDQSLNTTDAVSFDSVAITNGASFYNGNLIAHDDGTARYFLASDGSNWGAVGVRGGNGFIQASSGTMRIEGSGGSLAAIEANSASFAGGFATIGADGSASFGINGFPFSIDNGGNFSGTGSGYIASLACDQFSSSNSASFAGGAATIGADGTVSVFQQLNTPAIGAGKVLGGGFLMESDGTARGIVSLDDSSSRINFVNLTSFASIYLDDSGNVGIGPYYGSPVIVDSSSNMTVPGNITAANLPTTFFSGAYADLTGKPTLGTASSKDVAASGNASATQVVLGNDSRLTDSRTPTAHTHSAADITSGTLADARLSANVSLDNINNNFSVGQSINSGILTASAPALSITQTWNQAATQFRAITLNVTNTASASTSLLMDLQVGGTSVFQVDRSGSPVLGASANYRTVNAFINNRFMANNTAVYVGSSAFFGFTANALAEVADADTRLYRDSANTLGMRNGTTAQALRVYNTFTDASNYERGTFDFTTNANVLTIGTPYAGTGSARGIRIQAGGASPANVDVYAGTTQSASFRSGVSIIYTPLQFVPTSLSADPTTSDLSSGRSGLFKNTTSGAVKLWYNDAGTLKSVTLA